jgi:hypothetical protein
MIAPSVMSLIALPAFTDHITCTIDDCVRAIDVDLREPAPFAGHSMLRGSRWRRF